ncbi:hypothetical protein, partial [Streptosporangium album]|uniref:hypothetical protein n=1 Tax=Streptosporangium album TaxID=47479 RepID=UPI0031E6F5EC
GTTLTTITRPRGTLTATGTVIAVERRTPTTIAVTVGTTLTTTVVAVATSWAIATIAGTVRTT